MGKVHTILYKAFIVSFALITAAGCAPSWEDDMVIRGEGGRNAPMDRVEAKDSRKVLLLYSAGYNNLKGYLQDDIEELREGWLPTGQRNDDVLLVYTHSSVTSQDFTSPTTPYLIRLYSDFEGTAKADTLVTYPETTKSSSAVQLNEVLSYVRDNFHAGSYGMIFSSHATGFLPPGYYTKPSSYQFTETGIKSVSHSSVPAPVAIPEPEYDPSLPMTKSIGADYARENSNLVSYEMDLREFAGAIPMKLDYILFDACLMGGVEVAFELKDKCRRIGFSQAEVLAEGLDYKTLVTHLLKNTAADPQAVCEDYFKQYENKADAYRSATISLVSTEGMDRLASVCAPLIEKYRDRIHTLAYSDVQEFGGSKNYFFDLVDLLLCAGADADEAEALKKAVDEVVIYKNTTGQYYSVTDRRVHNVDLSRFSGLTMYMPRQEITELDKYYRTLSWNAATGLVKY